MKKPHIYELNGKWYVKTDRITLGPFDSREEAVENIDDEY